MKNERSILLFAFVAVLFCGSTANAHDAFKDPMELRYNLKTVSCKTCHPDGKDRSIHNKLGKLLEEELKGKDITKKFNEAEAAGDEAKEAYEKIMAEEFLKAMEVVEKEKLTIKDMIEAGLLNGTRLNTPKKNDK